MTRSVNCWVGILYVSFAMLPWVSFGTNKMDSQLWSLMLGILFIVLSARKALNIRVYAVFSVMPIVIFVGLVRENELTFQFLRAWGVYTSFAVNFVAFYIFMRAYGAPVKTVVLFNSLYIIVGVFQMIFDPSIVDAIVNVRTTDDRGVTSLAAEPTYFAAFLFFVSWWYLIITKYCPPFWIKVLLFINLASIVFLARSSMVLIFVLFALAALALYRLKMSQVIGAVVIGMAACFFIFFALDGTRIHELLVKLYDLGVLEVVSSDASINSRVADVVLPLHGFVNNVFLPGGFTSYGVVSEEIRESYNGFFWYGGGSNTIMSYIGSIVFELGFLGVLYVIAVGALVYNGTRRRFWELTLLFILLNSALSFGFTIVPVILATLGVLTKEMPAIFNHVESRSLTARSPAC